MIDFCLKQNLSSGCHAIHIYYNCRTLYHSKSGFQPYLKTCDSVISFSRPGKCMEFGQKVGKAGILTQSFEICKFSVLSFTFQNVIYKQFSFISLSYLHYRNTNTVIQRQIDLGFHCFYLEITWNIHVILCHQRSGNPEIVFMGLSEKNKISLAPFQ